MKQHEPTYDSVDSFSERTSLSTRAVWEMIRSGQLPSLKIGKRRLIPLAEAIEALERVGRAQARSPASEGDRGRGPRLAPSTEADGTRVEPEMGPRAPTT